MPSHLVVKKSFITSSNIWESVLPVVFEYAVIFERTLELKETKVLTPIVSGYAQEHFLHSSAHPSHARLFPTLQ
jgi:hypothetical protein